MAEELNKSNQSEPVNTQKVDNFSSYEKPLLRKHGKITLNTNFNYRCNIHYNNPLRILMLPNQSSVFTDP
ncbi:MAG: hypothetical protein MJK14_03890 [Rivularia sp. ALOHA_DT_140]|nr:hypothetical protein [Rivularia sp. ALOHA_DT_140]